MRAKVVSALAAAALAAAGVTGVAAVAGASSNDSSSPGGPFSRMDDGVQLLPEAKITEQQAIDAAQSAASGNLNEVDLEHYSGRLVFNVDVGSKDVKVDATTGKVLATPSDD
ncbi:MAG: PepSY domain-containing protein [Actinomycetota bacterium]|nr:PepSY domain-containing protein [Actinomycetota bacterium]